MKRLAIALGVALSLATTAFAQEQNSTSADQNSSDQNSTTDSQQANPAAQDSMNDHQGSRKHHRHHQRMASQSASESSGDVVVDNTDNGRHYSQAAEALTGTDAKTANYQASDRQKMYPRVDHGHVPGDPPVINHSGDQAQVSNPPATTVTVPPTN